VPSILGYIVTLKVDNTVIFQTENSLEDPSICGGYYKAAVCIDLTDMEYSSTEVKGCATLKVTLAGFKLGEWGLGCFTIDVDKISIFF